MDLEYKIVAEKLSWYLQEGIVNIQLHSDTIKMINERKNNFVKNNDFTDLKKIDELLEEGRLGNTKLDLDKTLIIEKSILSLVAEQQTSIFSFTLLKSMITSYFSIFEHYIYFIGNLLNLEKDDFRSIEEYIKEIWKKVGFGNFSELGQQEIFKRYREFYLRRNLYIHNYGFITEKYLEDINRKQLIDSIPKYYDELDKYKVGKVLPIDGTYFMMNGSSLNVIGISLTLLYINKNFEEKYFLNSLQIIYNFLLNNGDYEVTYMMIFSLLDKELNFNKYTDFTFGYLIALTKIYNKTKHKKFKKLKDDGILEYSEKINLLELTKIQKIIYFWLLNKDIEVIDIIKNTIKKEGNFNIFGKMYSYDFLCDFLIKYNGEFRKLYKKFGGEIKIEQDTTLNHIKKIKKILELLTT